MRDVSHSGECLCMPLQEVSEKPKQKYKMDNIKTPAQLMHSSLTFTMTDLVCWFKNCFLIFYVYCLKLALKGYFSCLEAWLDELAENQNGS